MIKFTVLGQPQGKGRHRSAALMRGGKPVIGAGGRPIIINHAPEKSVAYEGLVAHAAGIAMAGRPLITGPVRVAVYIDCQIPASWSGKKQRDALAGVVMPTGKPDSDNVIKAIYDGCNGVVWKDDAQVVDGAQRKRYSQTPGVRVFITLVGTDERAGPR